MPESNNEEAQNEAVKPKFHRLKYFALVLLFDGLSSIILLSPIISFILKAAGVTKGYSFYGSLYDLAILAAVRITAAVLGLLVSYMRADVPPEFPFGLYHANGDKKSREELEQEALEEDFCPWFTRFISRPCFTTEMVSMMTQVVCVSKCMYRMYKEIGTFYDTEPYHPLFWVAVLITTVLSVIEANYTESMCRLAGEYGKLHSSQPPTFLRSISSTLSIPLLSSQDTNDEEAQEGNGEVDVENQVGQSEIGPDANYKAGWTDLMMCCLPDYHLLCLAFVFLLLAAVAQVYIPRFLGHILDSLTAAFAENDDDTSSHESMSDIPGFVRNVEFLVIASLAAGIFAGLRGSIFTIVGARVNVRLRVMLMDSLFSQDIGFFDVTKTGDITSRLSSDTTLVGDQVTLNVNVFLRSLVQAIGVLLFMVSVCSSCLGNDLSTTSTLTDQQFVVSWQLTIIAFISVPLVTIVSKWYGEFLRSLIKLMQKKLADGNSVSEAAISAMRTVRAFDAAESELKEFEQHMKQYLKFNNRSALAYSGYAAFTTAMPQLVYAIVVFYGGLLVRNGDMTSGGLVSFLLYLTSLSDAFSSIGYVYSSLTQAVGAADKVFELMHRSPKYKRPSVMGESDEETHRTPVLGIHAPKTRALRARGLRPESIRGEIKFENVDLYYPARPNRKVLDQLTLTIDAGSVVALVGQSGGGKSSCMALIQHLYEQKSGKVMIDDVEVHELCHEWLSRNISIVSQEPTLFGRSVRSNIIYGLEGTEFEPTQEQIEEAARLANADGFIQKMPQKYDTAVGERGVQLSGGQRQRLAIARALVRKPKILLLDEATSALDAESEHLVQEAIDNMLARGKDGTNGGSMTVLIVAHRLSTVRNSDKIFVINEGKVVEDGSHDELLKNPSGAYASLIKRQMNAQSKLEGSA